MGFGRFVDHPNECTPLLGHIDLTLRQFLCQSVLHDGMLCITMV